jgi:retinoid X receptor alpha
MGMKREAVQEERQRNRDKNENEVESSTNSVNPSSVNNVGDLNDVNMPISRILDSELRVEPSHPSSNVSLGSGNSSLPHSLHDIHDPVSNICQAADRQLYQLVEWAKHIPHFVELPVEDQVVLLKAGWNELLIAGFSHRSMDVKDGIVLANGLIVHRNSAHSAGVVAIFDRVLTELVAKMRDMTMDKTELGCLRAIILYNPGMFTFILFHPIHS